VPGEDGQPPRGRPHRRVRQPQPRRRQLLCTTTACLDQGKVRAMGPTGDVINAYLTSGTDLSDAGHGPRATTARRRCSRPGCSTPPATRQPRSSRRTPSSSRSASRCASRCRGST
jgi:hypothetical protein